MATLSVVGRIADSPAVIVHDPSRVSLYMLEGWYYSSFSMDVGACRCSSTCISVRCSYIKRFRTSFDHSPDSRDVATRSASLK